MHQQTQTQSIWSNAIKSLVVEKKPTKAEVSFDFFDAEELDVIRQYYPVATTRSVAHMLGIGSQKVTDYAKIMGLRKIFNSRIAPYPTFQRIIGYLEDGHSVDEIPEMMIGKPKPFKEQHWGCATTTLSKREASRIVAAAIAHYEKYDSWREL